MTDTETISEWLNEEYNILSVYERENHVRLTNGSAGHYVDIHPTDNGEFVLHGERYGDVIAKTCDLTREALIETLARTL